MEVKGSEEADPIANDLLHKQAYYLASRRSKLELELLLTAFLERHAHGYNHDTFRDFVRLLQLDDPLLEKLLYSSEPATEGYNLRVVEDLRRFRPPSPS